MLVSLRRVAENLQETGRHFFAFLPGITALQKIRFGVEMGKTPVVGMVGNRLKPFARDHDFLQVGLWLEPEMILDSRFEPPPFRVERLEPPEHRLSLSLGQTGCRLPGSL